MNNISYYGVVRVNSGDEKLELHNKGTAQLGILITKALAGYSVIEDVPKYFMFEIKQEDEWVPLLNRNIPFTGIVYDTDISENDDKIGNLNFSCIILYTDKLIPSVSSLATLRLCMLNKKSQVLAQVVDTNLYKVFNDIVEGTDCIINWDMSFHNNKEDKK
jgi:hypothetical protein